MDGNIKKKVLSSLFWKLLERGGTQGVHFIVLIILARLLMPEDYGLLALVTILISLANVFIQSGFNTALIQKKEVDETDFSSVFYLSIGIAFLLYVVLFFVAPFISSFFLESQLTLIIRVFSLILVFGAINSVQGAIISRSMQFKKLFFSSLVSIIVSGIVGVIMAYMNFGVWSLVVQQLTNEIVITITLWRSIRWKPNLLFSFERMKLLFSFGWKLLLADLIDRFYMNFRSILIGKIFSPIMLGYYSKGKEFPSFLVTNINGSIQSVMLPVLSSQQDNKKRIKEMVRRSIVTSSFIVFPMMVGLAVVSTSLVKILLTEKWMPSVPFLQIYCMSYALWPINTANLQAINALGHSDIFLKLEIIKKVIGISILGVTTFYGIYAITLGSLLSGVVSTFINAYPNKRLLDYKYSEQFRDILPSLILSLVMGVIVFSIQLLSLSTIVTLTSQVILGIIVYISMASLFHLECYEYLVITVKSMLEDCNKSLDLKMVRRVWGR